MRARKQLYARKSEPGVEQAIEKAKGQFERRRCGHHPEAYAEPLSAEACVRSVVDAQGRGVNKHRYVCAVNDEGLRAALRQVPGVPLVFIRRSVVLMEPMAHATARVRSADERRKFRAEIKMPGGKRKRDEEDDDDGDDDDGDGEEGGDGNSSKRADATTTPKPDEVKKKRKPRGPKEPNPLAVKKKKKKPTQPESRPKADNQKKEETAATAAAADQPKKKRRRKHKGGGGGGGGEEEAAPTRDGEGAPAPVTA